MVLPGFFLHRGGFALQSHAKAAAARSLLTRGFAANRRADKYAEVILRLSGLHRPGIIYELTNECISPCEGLIGESRMMRLGADFSMLAAIRLHADKLHEFDIRLKHAFPSPAYSLLVKDTSEEDLSDPRTGRTVQEFKMVGPDSKGLVEKLTKYFRDNDLEICEMRTQIIPGGHLGYDIFEATVTVVNAKGHTNTELAKDLAAVGADLGVDIAPVNSLNCHRFDASLE